MPSAVAQQPVPCKMFSQVSVAQEALDAGRSVPANTVLDFSPLLVSAAALGMGSVCYEYVTSDRDNMHVLTWHSSTMMRRSQN